MTKSKWKVLPFVVVRHIVSTKTRKYPNTLNERSERMSKNETVKDVRVLVSFYAAREDDKIHLALLDIFLWKTQKSENLKGGTISLSHYILTQTYCNPLLLSRKSAGHTYPLWVMWNTDYKMNSQLIGTGLLFEQFSIDEPLIRVIHYP